MRGQTLLLCFALLGTCFGQLSSNQIAGDLLPPKTVVISIDDAPYQYWQSAPGEPVSWTDAIADYIASIQRTDENGNVTVGIPAIWFLVSCHFSAMPPPLLPSPASVVCLGLRDQDESLIGRLIQRGFVIGNHTHSHIPTSWYANPTYVAPVMQDSMFVGDTCMAQQLFGKYQDGWHFFRAPGFDWPAWAAPVANASSCLDHLDGPVYAEVGGAFLLDSGKWIGGDWDCPNQGLTAEQCGDLYLRDIRAVTPIHGAIVLLHNYVIPGAYALTLIKYIMENLDSDIRVVDIRTHPAFLHERRRPIRRR